MLQKLNPAKIKIYLPVFWNQRAKFTPAKKQTSFTVLAL